MAETEGASINLDLNCYMRGGCFGHDQLFAVYEKQDVVALIGKLTDSLGAYE